MPSFAERMTALEVKVEETREDVKAIRAGIDEMRVWRAATVGRAEGAWSASKLLGTVAMTLWSAFVAAASAFWATSR